MLQALVDNLGSPIIGETQPNFDRFYNLRFLSKMYMCDVCVYIYIKNLTLKVTIFHKTLSMITSKYFFYWRMLHFVSKPWHGFRNYYAN